MNHPCDLGIIISDFNYERPGTLCHYPPVYPLATFQFHLIVSGKGISVCVQSIVSSRA